MKALLEKLHARMGDFWWYSLMIFVAARAADCLNVFVGQASTPAFSVVMSLFALRKEQPKEKLLPLPVAIHRSNVIYYHPTRVVRPEPPERGEALANGEERFSPLFFF